MAATALDRNIQKRGPIRQQVLPLATGAVIPFGVIVMTLTPSTGALNGADTATGNVLGVSCQACSQTAGDTKIAIEKGIFKFAQDGTITNANIGALCELVDNQTVSLVTTTNHIKAGYIDSVESDGVFVDMSMTKVAAA
jgi:hypothetical protein